MKRSIRRGGRIIEYTLISSPNRTNVLLQALPEGKGRLYAPKGARLRDLDKLVSDRLDWIDEMHRRLDEEASRAPEKPLDSVLLEGVRTALEISTGKRDEVIWSDGKLYVHSRSTDEAAVAALVKKWLAERALQRIREALNAYSGDFENGYGRGTIREQKTRWGSCSSKHNLNFNWKLIMAPPQALTYVVIHELCHLRDFNHSKKFWSEVEKRMPDYDIWRKWLKTHGKELAFP